jgi:hypothetical protein
MTFLRYPAYCTRLSLPSKLVMKPNVTVHLSMTNLPFPVTSDVLATKLEDKLASPETGS